MVLKMEQIEEKEEEVKEEKKDVEEIPIEKKEVERQSKVTEESIKKFEATPQKEEQLVEKVELPLKKEEEVMKVLTDDEKKVLIVLALVEECKEGFKISGFQIKNFLERVFPDKDIDRIYWKLREMNLVSKKLDSEEFEVTTVGKEEAKKCRNLLEVVLSSLGSTITDLTEKNELLKYILYLAYYDKGEAKKYITLLADKLDEIEQVAAILFLNNEILQAPIIEKTVRQLLPKLIKGRLDELCKNPKILKTLAILNFDKIKNKIGIDTDPISYFPFPSQILDKIEPIDILSKILLVGITKSENLFNKDIDNILTKEENISKLRELFKFEKEKFKSQLEVDWNLFLDVKKIIANRHNPSRLKELLDVNAVFYCKDTLAIRKEVKEVYDEVYRKIEDKLKERVKDVENVIIQPFFERGKDELKKVKEKIIITLHAEDYYSNRYYYPAFEEELLEKNVILLISPKEIGFIFDKKFDERYEILESPDTNKEYNVIGEIPNLEKVKSRFNNCKWERDESYLCVREAKEKIEEKVVPNIPLEETLEELKIGKGGEKAILDNIFPALGREKLSSVFSDTSHKPRCIIMIGTEEQGRKIIEDLAKDELRFWGNYTPKTKQSDEIENKSEKNQHNDDKKFEDMVNSIPERDITSGDISNYLNQSDKIIEKVKEAETRGLKFILLYFDDKKAPQENREEIEKIRGETSIPVTTVLPNSAEKIKKILCEVFKGIEVSSDVDDLNEYWNELQREMDKKIEEIKDKIDEDSELKDILLREESKLHYVLKGSTCKYLRKNGYNVSVEAPQDIGKTEIVPDLIASKGSEKIFVEVETGIPSKDEIGEGDNVHLISPEERLKKKMQKYSKIEENAKILLIVPNNFVLTHEETLKNIKKYCESKLGKKVIICTMNWSTYPPSLIRVI